MVRLGGDDLAQVEGVGEFGADASAGTVECSRWIWRPLGRLRRLLLGRPGLDLGGSTS